MADKPQFNIQDAHKYFSAACFNKTWEYIDKASDRAGEDDMEMLHTAIASLWHWSQREDVTPRNLSVGYWQVARVYCLLGQPNNARKYGLLSLEHSKGLAPFYQGYAYETLARAEMILNNRFIMNVHLEKAHAMAIQVENEEDRQLLLKDLETIK